MINFFDIYEGCSNDMFHYMFKAEFVTLVSLKVPSGSKIRYTLLLTVVKL